MALGIPNLDQITATPLDSYTFLLDSSDELNRLEFSNPNLEQLDSWGLLDSLDTFGNLDSLSTLEVKQGSASVATSSTVSAVNERVRSVSASVATASTISANVNRIFVVTASVASVGNISATANYTVNADVSVSCSATASASGIRIQQPTASVATTASGNATANFLVFIVGNGDVIATQVSANNYTANFVATGDSSVTGLALAKIVGEDWTVIADGSETWTLQDIGSEVWTTQNVGSEVWLQQ